MKKRKDGILRHFYMNFNLKDAMGVGFIEI